MVYFREIIPFYGPTIWVSEFLQFAQMIPVFFVCFWRGVAVFWHVAGWFSYNISQTPLDIDDLIGPDMDDGKIMENFEEPLTNLWVKTK